MNTLRTSFDTFYDLTKPLIFQLTKNDPETAHSLFTNLCKFLHQTRLEKTILENSSNQSLPIVPISNAAGLNKDGKIHPTTLKYLGFNRAVIGTVTADPWKGNPKPRTRRFPKTQSLVNWMGLPGIGVEKVAEIISNYRAHTIPLTINLMTTPEKKGDDILKDLEKTISYTKNLPYVDRFELNISCPNTKHSEGNLDARAEYSKILKDMLSTVSPLLFQYQELNLKVSPDLEERDIDNILEITQDFPVRGYTTTNTTTNHNPSYIPTSPEKGGASGNAVYDLSLATQKLFHQKTKNSQRIIACGGINTTERLQERMDNGATEIQIYTPLIFTGPKLLRKLREY